MTLETLQKAMIESMKSGDKFRKSIISTTIARIKSAAIDKGCRDNITEEMVDAELIKAKKMSQEMLDTCPESRQDLLKDYQKQMDIICEFAPKLITDEDEILDMVLERVREAEVSLKQSNRGAIMKLVSPHLKGKADMGVVSKVVGNIFK